MLFFGIIFLIVFCIIAVEKPRLISDIIYNVKTVKGFIMNIIYILPFLMIFFNIDSFSNWISSRTNVISLSSNTNNKLHWSEDPIKRKHFKKKQLRKVSESTKKVVASNQKWRCFMCHNLLDYSYEIDHNTPLFLGGTNHISNLHALCRNCHGKKTIIEKINPNY